MVCFFFGRVSAAGFLEDVLRDEVRTEAGFTEADLAEEDLLWVPEAVLRPEAEGRVAREDDIFTVFLLSICLNEILLSDSLPYLFF